jgi:predicted kinase
VKKGTLIFFCGKMGSGKTTRSMGLAQERNAVILSEDEWLESLYPKQIFSLEDYIKYSSLLKPQMKNLVQSILIAGTDVVMDFPANTISQREWFKDIFSEIEAPHVLIFIDASNELCLSRIEKKRKDLPERSATDTVEMFEQVTKYFVAPSRNEGFNIKKEG